MKLDYTRQDGYMVPNLTLPEPPKLGKYGMMRLQYLTENRPALYEQMRLAGTLNSHLLQFDEQAHQMVENTLQILMETARQQMQEPDKVSNPLGWTGWVSNLKAKAEELTASQMLPDG